MTIGNKTSVNTANEYQEELECLDECFFKDTISINDYNKLCINKPYYLMDDNVLDRKSINIFIGNTLSAKDVIALDMGLSLAYKNGVWADGDVFTLYYKEDKHPTPYDFNPEKHKEIKVLYICSENLDILKKRIAYWLIYEGKIKASDKAFKCEHCENFKILSLPLKFDEKESVELLNKINNQYQPDLIIIDNIRRCMNGNPDSYNDVRKVLLTLENIKNLYDCSIIALMHIKDENDPCIYNNKAWIDYVDCIKHIQKESTDDAEFCKFLITDLENKISCTELWPHEVYSLLEDNYKVMSVRPYEQDIKVYFKSYHKNKTTKETTHND